MEAAEELLKYKADPDIKNKLGYLPIHCAWQFWKKKQVGDRYRTKEEREKQEEDTYAIVKHILSYNAYVDGQDIFGNTALHMACRLGELAMHSEDKRGYLPIPNRQRNCNSYSRKDA